MTPKEFNDKIKSQIKKISDAKFLLTCVSEVHARQVKRVFTEGKDGDEAQIGVYNETDPIYINPNQSPKKFPLKGKTGESKFKNGKPHKTGYFDSYKAFRQKISRETSFVNLRLTENLKFDFTNSLTLNGSLYQTGVKRKENAGKVEGHVKKYGIETYQLTQAEKKIFQDCVTLKLNATLNN